MNFLRAISQEGYGRIRYFRKVREQLVQDRAFRGYFEGETKVLPAFFENIIRKDLGIWWEWLPAGAMDHNPNIYLEKQQYKKAIAV